jgi:DNA-binding winged helix-turn-helix (wHTH) protein/tetratricopeptide (TPR) repeat protein
MPRSSRLVRFGVFEFDVETGDLWNQGHRIRLQDQPRQVLHRLVAHPGELITREALRAALWPDDTFVDFDAGLNVVINKIRHVLRDSASSPRFIETLPRRGYRFIAPVASGSADDDVRDPPAEVRDVAGVNAEALSFGRFRALSRRRGTRWRGLLAGSAAVAAAGISTLFYLSRADSSHRPVAVTSLSAKEQARRASTIGSSNRVAVATFENRTGDASLEPLGQLVAERIIRMTATVGGVQVVPQPIRMAGGATSELAPPVPDLGAALLVRGTYYADEDGLEFQTRILDAAGGRLLHGTAPVIGSRSQPADALQLMEQRVAGATAIHFDEFFGGLHVVSHPPTLDAYREYRAGLETFASDYPRALKHLERALQRDPEFLLPLVIMYFAHCNLEESNKVERVERVLARMEGQWDRLTPAERLLVEFLRANWDGRRAQALRVLEDLERLVPTSLLVNFNLVQKSLQANRLRAAVDAYGRLSFSERTLRHSIGTMRHLFVQHALHLLGEYAPELQQAKRAQQDAPANLRFFETEARALVALGRVADVLDVIDRCLSSTAEAGPSWLPGEIIEVTVFELRAHRYQEESLKLAARAVDWYRNRSPDMTASHVYRDGLAHALYAAERWEEASALFSALAAENPDELTYIGHLGSIAARTKNTTRARGISAELARVRGREKPYATYLRSRIAALLQERERAVELLRDAFALGIPYGLHLHSHPDFEPLRDYKPFVELLQPLD